MPERFDYYEVRPCVTFGVGGERETVSFRGKPQYSPAHGGYIFTQESALEEATDSRERRGHLAPSPVFWILYGIDETGEARAIGDFTTFDAAYETMLAILAPLVAIRNEAEQALGLDADNMRQGLCDILTVVEDVCLQSSTPERP